MNKVIYNNELVSTKKLSDECKNISEKIDRLQDMPEFVVLVNNSAYGMEDVKNTIALLDRFSKMLLCF